MAVLPVDMFDVVVLTSVVAIGVYYGIKKLAPSARPASDTAATPSPDSSTPDTADDADYDRSNFVHVMKKTGKNAIIFYGTQTGTAEEFAERLAKQGKKYGLKAMTADPEAYDMASLAQLGEVENSLAMFCMATYGEGDPTDNAVDFVEFLETSKEQDDLDLKGVRYAVFALGNKTYECYNTTGRFVDATLAKLGGQRVFEHGEGDDDGNIEEDFERWTENLWPAVCEAYGFDANATDSLGVRSFTTQRHEVGAKAFIGEMRTMGAFAKPRRPFNVKNPFLASVAVNRELYSDLERSCRHIEIDIKDQGIRYSAGDHVGIYPTNRAVLVEGIAKALSQDLDEVITLTAVDPDASKKHPFPCPCSFRTALSHYVDITSPLKPHHLLELSVHATDEAESKRLRLLGSKEGRAEYRQFVLDVPRDVLDVLEAFPSVAIPLDHLLELLPRLQVRYYSISSSPRLNPGSIHVTAAVVRYTTAIGREKEGVCTGFLAAMPQSGDGRAPVFIRQSTFRLPARPSANVMLVGPGTGLAPFRGFLQDRQALRAKGKELGTTVLYFGCQHRAKHFLYEDELAEFQNSGVLTELHTAFSRDQAEKQYVQHLIQANAASVWQHLNTRGYLYVCGDAKRMANDVHSTLVAVIQEHGGKTADQATALLREMKVSKRYQVDVW